MTTNIDEIEAMMEEVHSKYFPKVVEYKKLLRYPYNYMGDNGILDILIHWHKQQQAQNKNDNDEDPCA